MALPFGVYQEQPTGKEYFLAFYRLHSNAFVASGRVKPYTHTTTLTALPWSSDSACSAYALEASEIVQVTARDTAGEKTFSVRMRSHTPVKLEYYLHGGILQYVLRQTLAA